MKKLDRQVILEFVKEFLRIGVLAIIPVLIAQLESQKVDFKVLGVIFVVAILKAADKSLHEAGKLLKDENLKKGLVRF